MRGKKYQALIVVILLLTALPYSPFLSRASTIEKNPLAESDKDGDGIPDQPFRDSDGDGLSDDYEISLGFDPNDFDMDNDGIPDNMEMDFWNDLINEDFVPPNMEDLYDCDGDLDGDGISNCMDPDADGDGVTDQEEMMDSDGDGIPDMYENMIDHLDPNNPDSDGDGIPDKLDQDPPLPSWAEEMAENNDWTPQPDCNGCSGNPEAFYPLAMLAAVKFTVACTSSNCGEPTANPQYWRTVAKDIYDNGYDETTGKYNRNQWCPAPGCEQYGIESSIVEDPGFWSTGDNDYTYDYLVTNPQVTSEEYEYTISWIMPASGYLSTALYTNSVYIANQATMDSAFNLRVEGYAQSYQFTMTEYYIPEEVKRAANAPDNFPSQLTELPNFPQRPGPDNDVYDLAASITEGKTTDYEKAEAIMYHLRNNYYYNINGTLTPDGDDYIDYFLFGNPGQDGKCTNFASAFNVLARLNGIPTRYVEGNGPGSVITPQEWKDKGYESSTGYAIPETTRVVTMLNGHAYAEVLLDGIGWITFEPTSSTTCPTCDPNTAATTGEDDNIEGNGTQPGTDYEINDSDDDGLSDEYENGIGTDPFNPDTDGDTIPDGSETGTGIYVNTEDTGTSPLTDDTDDDGLQDDDEILCRLSSPFFGGFCSHPLDSDSDNDGLTDGDEYYIHNTNPIDFDSDDDGLLDGLELGISHENPWTNIPHNLQACETKTGDVLTNCRETWQSDEDPESTTDPLDPDSDGDGIEDGIEDLNHNGKLDLPDIEELEPCNYETDPTLDDTDEGGRTDFEECEIDSTNPRDSEDDIGDYDLDGLNNHVEEGNCIYGTGQNQCTNFESDDTDGDGINDYDEIFNCFYGENNDQCTDPTIEDTDGDGINDNIEINNCIYGEDNNECTDPTLIDTDGGGTNDVLEINSDFTNPLDKSDDIEQGDRDDDEDGLKNVEEDVNLNGILDPGETDPNNPDTDGDGLEDGDEVLRGTDPRRKDSDNDGLEDGDEVTNITWGPTDPLNPDSDEDGSLDGDEANNCIHGETNNECTDPNNPDSDGDGLNDGDELDSEVGSIYVTDPLIMDTDDDGLNDGDEVSTYETNPALDDTDSDGLLDGDEIGEYDTNPTLNDTDSDGLLDGDEINEHDTNPNLEDSDSDGLTDWVELFNTTWGPTDPNNSDTDEGGQKDGLEVLVDGTDPNEGSDDDLSALDDDNDGLTNGEEEGIYGTDPSNPDSDGDGLKDGDEVNNWTTKPLKIDSDFDGIEDGTETINCIYGEDENECTDPMDDDSDDDGLEDGDEVNNLTTDPKNTDTDDDGLSDSTEVNNCVYGEDGNGCTSPINPDTDLDGLEDGDELIGGTDPMDPDSDDDGLSDGYEINNCVYGEDENECTSPNIADSDGDTLPDGDELIEGTDPMDTDTDDDEINDGIELVNCIYGVDNNQCTDPNNPDSDGDSVNDYDEIFNCIYGVEDECTDPLDVDSEDDGVNDGDEINFFFSDPMDTDTDGDGLDDGIEVSLGTNLTNADTDDDDLSDYVEVTNCIYGQNNTGSDCTDPTESDSDSDGLNDWFEITLSSTDPMDDDSDGDRLTDSQEIEGQDGNGTSHGHGATDPLDDDSDNGGIRDGTEVDTDDTNPNDLSDDFLDALDNDGDGLSNGEEILEGTDPDDPDSDDDGLIDGDEVYGLNNTYSYTSDPNEPDSDGDGLNDSVEISNCVYGTGQNECTNPENADSDGDGLNDSSEINNCIYGEDNNECTDPRKSDSDNEGLNDYDEINEHDTDPMDNDSDDDGLDDLEEVFWVTDPNDTDSDDDGLTDNVESWLGDCFYGVDNDQCTNPIKSDSDDDGINDYDEIFNCFYGEDNNECTDPQITDSDGDGLNDYDEINEHDTDPMDYDSDKDGLSDGLEVNSLYSNPLNIDSDSDGLNDTWEWVRATEGHPYSLTDNDTDDDGVLDGSEDLDNDGLSNLDEIQGNNDYGYITSPLNSDTDGDSLFDGDEIYPLTINKDTIDNQYNYPSDPTKKDSDDDLVNDLEEVLPSNDTYNSRTNPKNSDTDGDGLNDYYELFYYWNITGDDNTPQLFYDIQGWNTSNPKEENTDEDNWDDGDIDEENPVYGNFEDEDPPWGSPPSRAETPEAPPEIVYKDQEFIWSFNMINVTSEEPYVGVLVEAYINETDDYGSPYHKIGQGISDSEGFVKVICNISAIETDVKSGDWRIKLHRPLQFIIHANESKRIIESWSPALDLKVKGNSSMILNIPVTGASQDSTIVTGKLIELNDLDLEGQTVELTFDDEKYYEVTNEDGSFAIEINLPEVEDQLFELGFKYNGTENITEYFVMKYIRVINASINLSFDEDNENVLELGNTYSIGGSILGDLIEPPVGTVSIQYGGSEVGNIDITGNQDWEFELTIPGNASWGETILTATYLPSVGDVHPSDVSVYNIIIKGQSSVTIESMQSNEICVECLRTNIIKLEGNLTDHNNENIPEQTVNLYFDEMYIGSAETNSQGRYTFSADLSLENSGEHSVSVQLFSSESLVGNSSIFNLSLLASPSLIFDEETKCEMTLDDEWLCKSERNSEYFVSGTVIDELGIPIPNASLEIEIDSYLLIKTDENGQFSYSTFVDEGQTDIFEIDISIVSSSSIERAKNSLSVIPQTTVIIIVNASDALRGENTTVNGLITDNNGVPVDNVTIGVYIAQTEYYVETDMLGTFNLNYTLVSNYDTGLDNITVVFNETQWYLEAQQNTTFKVSGTSSFDSVKIKGDWFGGKIVRGGTIEITGILIDDLGNRLEGNITAAIGNKELDVIYTNQSTFIANGIIPENYRNNKTLELNFLGSEYLIGTSYNSEETILVISNIDFEIEQQTNDLPIHPGDIVNITITLTEDDGSALPYSTIYVNTTMYQLTKTNSLVTIENENLNQILTTDENGKILYSFIFPRNGTTVSIDMNYDGGYIKFDEKFEASLFTEIGVSVSITKSPTPVAPFDFKKYIPLFIGIPAALIVTVYYMYWTQKHKYEVRNLIKQMQKELNKDEDYRQIIIKSYHQLLNILSRYGFIKTNTQTVREFTDVMSQALPIPVNTVRLLTSLFEIARYSGIKPKVVDEFGMEMIDGSYNIWCVEAINNLHQVEHELNAGLKQGKVSRFTNIFGMRRT